MATSHTREPGFTRFSSLLLQCVETLTREIDILPTQARHSPKGPITEQTRIITHDAAGPICWIVIAEKLILSLSRQPVSWGMTSSINPNVEAPGSRPRHWLGKLGCPGCLENGPS